jgi:hypothetical protein
VLQLQPHAGMPPCLGVLDHCAGNGHALLLPAAERNAALPQLQTEGQGRAAAQCGAIGVWPAFGSQSGEQPSSGRLSRMPSALQPCTETGLYCLTTLPHTLVLYRSGRAEMNVWALAARAAASTCSSVASGRPYRMFSATGQARGSRLVTSKSR